MTGRPRGLPAISLQRLSGLLSGATQAPFLSVKPELQTQADPEAVLCSGQTVRVWSGPNVTVEEVDPLVVVFVTMKVHLTDAASQLTTEVESVSVGDVRQVAIPA